MSLEQLVLLAGFTGVALASFPPRRLGRAMMVTLRWSLRAGLIAVATAGVMLTVNPHLLPDSPAWPMQIRDWFQPVDGRPPLERLLLGVASLLASVSVPLIAALDALLTPTTGSVPTPLAARLAGVLGRTPGEPALPRSIPEAVAAAALPPHPPIAMETASVPPKQRRMSVGEAMFGKAADSHRPPTPR